MNRQLEERTNGRPPQVIGEPLHVAGLFAGIGGIEAGLHRAGHTTALLCEIDKAALAVLEERFPGVSIETDVTELSRLPDDVRLLAGGFPCQDLSQAGQTRGLSGKNSGLVSHVFRLLEAQPVDWVLLENVPFMLQLSGGRALDAVVAEFERLGYAWAYRVIDSRAFGVPQRRERVYLVASRVDDPRKVLFKGNEEPRHAKADITARAFGFYWTEGNRGLGGAVDAIPTLKGGSTIGIPSPPAILLPSGNVVKPDIRDAERMQGFEEDWTEPAERVARKGSRWKLVGNAVTVDVAEWIGERLRLLDGDASLPGMALVGKRWPTAAWNVGEGRFAAELSTWPTSRGQVPLHEFLKHPPTPLSIRATSGFLSRARASSLRFPEGFLDALQRHVERMMEESDNGSASAGSRRRAVKSG